MKLLENIKIGSIELKNRIVMAPMTRSRADENGIVGPSTVLYYKQRASAGLLITEATNITPQAQGSPFTPGIYSAPQIQAWKKVTDAVHAEGGKIFMQLWHTGRVGHSSNKRGELPVAPSAIRIEVQKVFTPAGMQDYEVPRALETHEVKDIVLAYATAAANAKEAGFDGVELHGAFGYLPNQFLVDSANHRTDEYGGSIENRSRFMIEIMEALVNVWGPGKVSVKLSPLSPYNGMNDSNPEALFSYLIGRLNEMPLAYLQLMRPLMPLDNFPTWPKDVLAAFGGLFDKAIIANGKYDCNSAEQELQDGKAQLISFGAPFVANPDLVRRFELNAPLNEQDKTTFYGGGDKGYIDYPTLEASQVVN